MKNFRRVISLLLALCLCFSLVIGASAEEVCNGRIGTSEVNWSFDFETGHLIIGGSGEAPIFQSKEDQPWAAFRDQITEVWFENMAAISIPDMAYWFTDCINLEMAEIPYMTSIIGMAAFSGCLSLRTLLFYYINEDVFSIEKGAFATEEMIDTRLFVVSSEGDVLLRLAGYDWIADGRNVSYYDVYTPMLLVTYCYEGGNAHQQGTARDWVDSCHYKTSCKWCGQYLSTITSHTYIDGVCKNCGAGSGSGNSGGGSSTSCSHRFYNYKYDQYNSSYHMASKICTSCFDVISTAKERHSATEDGNSCSKCGYVFLVTITWDIGDGSSVTTQQTPNTLLVMPEDPTRTGYTFSGWFTSESGGLRLTESTLFSETTDTTYYAQWAPVFSVTVPASLPLAMSKDGTIHAAPAQIINNSASDVEVTSLMLQAARRWTLVPFTTDMAHEKVDANLVGFRINGTATTLTGAEEYLPLTGDWTIPQNSSLDLDYDAVISAVSQAVQEETILSAIFVLKWS